MNPRIMVVEDDIVSGEALREKMRDLGFEALPLLTTAEEALARVGELHPDLVLMDIRLAGNMDGVEAAGRLTADHDVAVVFMTAFSDDAVLERAKQTGGHGYLIKPVRDRELVVTIEMALARHTLELRLKEQSRQLDAIFNTVPIILMVVDDDRRVERVNRIGFDAPALSAEGAEHLGPGDVLHCAVAAKAGGCGVSETCAVCPICAAIAETSAGKAGCRNRETFIDVVDGDKGVQQRHFVISTSPVELAGEPRVLLALNDVTDEQRAQEAVRRAESRFQNLIEGIGEDFVVFSHDADGIVDYVSPSAPGLLGREVDDILGRQWTELAAWEPDGVSRAFRALSSLIAGGTSAHEELMCGMPDGSRRELGVSWYPVHDAAGRVESIEGIIQDVTEQRRHEAVLAAAREHAESASLAKTRFLANMSHEIRTPLNAIVGYAQLMARDGDLHGEQAASLDVICRSSDHLTALIDDLLEMSKIEAGRNDLLLSDFDLRELLDEVMSFFRARAMEKRISLSLKCADDLRVHLRGDERKVRQVLINMVSNAMKYTDHGSVVVRAGVDAVAGPDLRLVIEVADTGCGIEPGELGMVFDPFEQTTQGRRRGEGTGLGMPISRAFARLMGGDVTVTSEPGVGSKFRFEFRTEPGSEPRFLGSRTAGVAVSIAGTSRQVAALVVDDLDVDRHILVRLLERVGFVVDEASSGEEAIERAATSRPDVVLMDRRMPGMNGVEATRGLRARLGPDLPVVMVSASVVDEDPAEARAAGVAAFVSKPVREQALYDAVARAAGIEFVYEAEPAPPAPPPPPQDAAEFVPTLPGDVRRELRSAVTAGDLARVGAIVAALPTEHAAAGTLVQQLAGAYEYERLLEVL